MRAVTEEEVRLRNQLEDALREVVRLRERCSFLAYALAESSASPFQSVSEEQFSILAKEDMH